MLIFSASVGVTMRKLLLLFTHFSSFRNSCD